MGQCVQQLVERLHGVLRPFLLRRLKSEVERQVGAWADRRELVCLPAGQQGHCCSSAWLKVFCGVPVDCPAGTRSPPCCGRKGCMIMMVSIVSHHVSDLYLLVM